MSNTENDRAQERGRTTRTELFRLIAAYDRKIVHPEIYEDLKDE